jgi:hypothetical protein
MSQNDIEKAVAHVRNDRRGFFKTLLIGAGTAAVAVPLMTTLAMAQKEGEDPGPNGTCDDGLVVSKKTGKCAVKKKKAPDAPPAP